MSNKKALITGITGQDGYYLSRYLIELGYEVYGMVRRVSRPDYSDIHPEVKIVYGDMTDQASLDALIKSIRPDEVYNLAAQSFVGISFDQPHLTYDVTGNGVLRILEAIRKYHRKAKFYQAGSSEMFGDVESEFQNENTMFRPRSPYGVAKVTGHFTTKVYRESYNIFACSGILMNHESPRRGIEFVTRKITHWAARYKKYPRSTNPLILGNIYAKRDWGHANDFVKAMHLMLQQQLPDDYVVATGKVYSVQDFVNTTMNYLNIPIEWVEEENESPYAVLSCPSGKCKTCICEEPIIKSSSLYSRPSEVEYLCGDYTKIKELLGWQPTTSFDQLVKMMVDHDLEKCV